MVFVARGVLAALLVGALGCNGAPPKPTPLPFSVGAERTAYYRSDAIRAHEAVVEALQGLGEKIEDDRADGGFVQSASGERPDRTWIRTRVWISPQREAVTRITVRRSVARRVSGTEIEWTSLPSLPEAGEQVLDALDRRMERAVEPRR